MQYIVHCKTSQLYTIYNNVGMFTQDAEDPGSIPEQVISTQDSIPPRQPVCRWVTATQKTDFTGRP